MTPVNRALNEPVRLMGIDYPVLLILLIVSVIIFLILSRWGGAVILIGSPLIVRRVTRKDSKMLQLWSLSFQQRANYDPGKRR